MSTEYKRLKPLISSNIRRKSNVERSRQIFGTDGYITEKDKGKKNVTKKLNSCNKNELIVYSDSSQQVYLNGECL